MPWPCLQVMPLTSLHTRLVGPHRAENKVLASGAEATRASCRSICLSELAKPEPAEVKPPL